MIAIIAIIIIIIPIIKVEGKQWSFWFLSVFFCLGPGSENKFPKTSDTQTAKVENWEKKEDLESLERKREWEIASKQSIALIWTQW